MKTMISLLILAATLKASASFYVEYNSEARWLLTDVVSLCPNEMIEALQAHGVVSSAVKADSSDPDKIYQQTVIKTSTRPHPLVRKTRELAVLTINRVAPRAMPADGGPMYKTTCELKKNY